MVLSLNSRLESTNKKKKALPFLSHHSRFTCECNKEEINDDDDDDE